MDPVTAISQGVGSLADFLGSLGIGSSKKNRADAQTKENTQKKDWFSKYKTDFSSQYLYIVFGIFALLAIMIIVLVFKKK